MQSENKEFEVTQLTNQEMIDVMFFLASINKSKLENVCSSFYNFGLTKIPEMKKCEKLTTEITSITSRKSPCGEGTNTWARYKMHVHRRAFQLSVTHDILARMADFLKSADVEVILKIKK